jgi:demethylmenaquinone methyltransferase/2-methoxy-6-polyprenyl-1,4-benzoquinol methylase
MSVNDAENGAPARDSQSNAAPARHNPHPPLTAYYADASARRAWVNQIFDSTAADYDLIERAMAFGSGAWYRRRSLRQAGLRPGMRVLDVGMGTGLVTREALAIVGDPSLVTGVDPSTNMRAAASLPAAVRVLEGRAEALPCGDASCDFLSMGFALRHVDDLALAFAEYHRVLAPGGRVCILEITRPRHRLGNAVLKGYMRTVVPILARLLGRQANTAELMRYYWDTIEACVSPEEVMAALVKAGFTEVRRDVELGIFSAYTGTR